MMQQIVLVSYAQQKNKIDVRTCACSEAAVPSVNKCKPTFDTRSCRYKCAFSGRRLPKQLLLARESYGAEAGHLLGVPWVARLNQHNTEVGVLSCHTR